MGNSIAVEHGFSFLEFPVLHKLGGELLLGAVHHLKVGLLVVNDSAFLLSAKVLASSKLRDRLVKMQLAVSPLHLLSQTALIGHFEAVGTAPALRDPHIAVVALLPGRIHQELGALVAILLLLASGMLLRVIHLFT